MIAGLVKFLVGVWELLQPIAKVKVDQYVKQEQARDLAAEQDQAERNRIHETMASGNPDDRAMLLSGLFDDAAAKRPPQDSVKRSDVAAGGDLSAGGDVRS